MLGVRGRAARAWLAPFQTVDAVPSRPSLCCRSCQSQRWGSLSAPASRGRAAPTSASRAHAQVIGSPAKDQDGKAGKSAYSATLQLPATEFPIRADAAKRELLFRDRTTSELYRWQWNRFREQRRKAPGSAEGSAGGPDANRPFVLHDGPPYANGNLHMGHAMNKILKDIICRYQVLRGRGVHYAPGWDCHGLPIELKALAEGASAGSQTKTKAKKGKADGGSDAAAAASAADKMSPLDIRRVARQKALEAIEVQKGEFKMFGIMADWDDPQRTYRTLDVDYEVGQLRIFAEMARKGLIYRARRPVYWSPSTRTALAEAELEYIEDYLSHSVYVRLPVASISAELRAALQPTAASSEAVRGVLEGQAPLDLLIWTTTPWSLPSNMAVAVNPELEYCLVTQEGSTSASGAPRLLIIGADRVDAISKLHVGPHKPPSKSTGKATAEEATSAPSSQQASTVGSLRELGRFSGSALLGSRYAPPLRPASARGDLTRPVIAASYVTADTGTGLVHTAPAHGAEDYECMKALGLLDEEQPFSPIDDSGCFTDDLASSEWTSLASDASGPAASSLVGQPALSQGARAVVSMLDEAGLLLSEVPQRHRYPCDWRSKQPVIVRATWQWFADLSRIKGDALRSLDSISFVPPSSRTRLQSFVRGRSEWCISRQRAWGVPIPVLYNEQTGEPLLDDENVQHILAVLKDKGTDYWWSGEAHEFVAPRHRQDAPGASWRKGSDTIDVWFDSGSSWAVIQDYLAKEGIAPVPSHPVADVYLEGSDQHRGWFQSSLLTRIATSSDHAAAPYKHVITHGMVVDKDGKKMSKSIGNTISPLEFIQGNPKRQIPAYGADVLRLWVARSDYTKEAPVGNEIVKKAADALRKLRNTARFMLANLKQQQAPALDGVNLQLCELYTLRELSKLESACREAYETFDFATVARRLNEFASTTLSAFYLDVTKDSLYSDPADSARRQAVLATLDQVLRTTTSILAPIAPHLAEEIHEYRDAANNTSSVFESGWQAVPESFASAAPEGDVLFGLREAVLALIEQARQQSLLKSASECDLYLVHGPNTHAELSTALNLHDADLARFFNVSQLRLCDAAPASADWRVSSDHGGLQIVVQSPAHAKCPRCWLSTRPHDAVLCERCDGAVRSMHA